MSRPPTRQHVEPEMVIWSMPCAEMLKEVVRLMNTHNPRALLGLTPLEQEDVNRYMQAWNHRREEKLLSNGSIGHEWPPSEAMLEYWSRTHRVEWIQEVVSIEFVRDQAIKRIKQQSTDILFDPSTKAPPFVKRSGRKHPPTHRFTVADCLAGFHHFHDAPGGFAEQEGGGFYVHPPAGAPSVHLSQNPTRASSTHSSPVSSPISQTHFTSRMSGLWSDMPANMSEVGQARREERPVSSYSMHHRPQLEERPPSSARHGQQHPHEAFPASPHHRGQGDEPRGSAWERFGGRQNAAEEQELFRHNSQPANHLHQTNTLPVPPSHALHHYPSNEHMPYRAYTDPTQHTTQHHQQEGPLPPHPAHVPQPRTGLHKRVLRKASGFFKSSRR
ncbi:putative RNA binding protein [Rhodotorula toruloides ATCC 204091]|nr:putative RNA binding protein [Rhodotorula toruloides ATCC 204091]KAK4332946.1 putative RNA binding protein [Rhodotorula toruloides]